MIKVGTWGSFDYIIHIGHLTLLKEAKQLGDYLCVFVIPDDVIIINKHRNPFYGAERRASNLLSTGLVDSAIVLRSIDYVDNVENQILPLCLDKYLFGRDQTAPADMYLRRRLNNVGIEVFVSKSPEIVHTTELLIKDGWI